MQEHTELRWGPGHADSTVCNFGFTHANAQPLPSQLFLHLGMQHQLNLSCVSYDDRMNGMTAAFFINPAKWPHSKGLQHFFSVQNPDKHVSSKNAGIASLSPHT